METKKVFFVPLKLTKIGNKKGPPNMVGLWTYYYMYEGRKNYPNNNRDA
jgi:hypothetical protein